MKNEESVWRISFLSKDSSFFILQSSFKTFFIFSKDSILEPESQILDYHE